MADLIPFAEAIARTADGPRSAILGNGFSIAQGGGHFAYANLLERAGLAEDSPIRSVFEALGTVDFEAVMQGLEHAALIEKAYGELERSQQFSNDAAAVRAALMNAVRAVHPGVQFEIPKAQIEACGKFTSLFSNIFTVNYDLLLYWAILNADRIRHRDGFCGRSRSPRFLAFQERNDCTIHYLHGALHLFVDRSFETSKLVKGGSKTILDRIASTIEDTKQLPLIVAEGTSAQKKSKIYSVPYLRRCYENLEQMVGSVFVFGHSASDGDKHIYDAVFGSEITQFALLVHDPENNLEVMREKLARYAVRNANVEFLYVDASDAQVWG